MNKLSIKFQQIVIANIKFFLSKKTVCAFLAFFFFIGMDTSCALPLKKTEGVILFPVSAAMTKNGQWKIPIHHWVYEMEEGSFIRAVSRKVIAESLEFAGLTDEETDTPTFKQRIKWFLTDNKGWKTLSLSIKKPNIIKSTALNSTALNGHAYTDVYLAPQKELRARSWIQVEIDTTFSEKNKFIGEVQLIPSNGLSVISDIDDTIKISEVLDKKKLLKNIFVVPYQAVKGMPALYKRLKERGAYFHYVSASPWRLYPELKHFIEDNYPKGTLMFRYFRLKDTSFIKFLGSSQAYKVAKVSAIIRRYPKHRFILIGDSGEHDADVYAAIYRQFPKNIQSIWIRDIPKSTTTIQSLEVVFRGIPRQIWRLFKNPEKLKVN